ncbi:MAG: molybdopterin-dependent oxidoreductase, partial [Gammaproteobacteria bacterium]|nr:molybdopterin-dependent oxidoreductase [Gammaproteobacteria bacterium]
EALELAAKGLKQTAADQLGVLASPSQTNEDYFLLQQLVRGLGGNHIDHRLRQGDFSATAGAGSQANANAINALQATDLVVLVGSNLRKDQPLLWVRVRNALRHHGIKLVVINPKNYDLTIKANEAFIGSPAQMANDLAGIVKSMPDSAALSIDGWQESMASDSHRRAAELISAAENPVVVVGNQSYSSDNYASLNALAAMLATQAGGELIELGYGANSHGAFQAGAVAHGLPGGAEASQPGLNASAMFEQKLAGYLLLGIEPEHDCWDSSAAINALSAAELVVVMNAFVTDTMRDYADVLLPVAAFTEQSGSMVNLLGDMQRFRANVKPLGEARPAWKVLRVLGNHLDLDGFEYADLKQVTDAFLKAQESTAVVPNHIVPQLNEQKQLMRVADAPIYAIDSLTRRTGPLQERVDSLKAAVYVNKTTASAQRLEAGKQVTVSQGKSSLSLDWVVDDLLSDQVVYIPAGVPGTETLGSMVGPVTVAGS